MIETSKSDLSRPAGSSEEDNAPVNVDAILQSILGRGGERFGMAAAVLRGERIIAQGVAGVRKKGAAERITLDDRFHLGSSKRPHFRHFLATAANAAWPKLRASSSRERLNAKG